MENNTSLQQQLLEAGVHFGHLKKKWNPKMLPYIFAEKKGIPYALIAGQEEFATGKFQMKNLKERTQESMGMGEILELLNQKMIE